MNPVSTRSAFVPSIRLLISSLMVVAMLFAAAGTAFADKSKKVVTTKPATSKDRRAAAVIKYGTPYTGAVEATLSDAARNTKVITSANKTQRTQNGADSTPRESRIVSIRATADVFSIRIELEQDEQTIDLGIYNMLGKKVHDVYRGYASRGPHDYSVPISDLPEGVYICIAQASSFRRAEKFYLSR